MGLVFFSECLLRVVDKFLGVTLSYLVGLEILKEIIPAPFLSHGHLWVSAPRRLLRRWYLITTHSARMGKTLPAVPKHEGLQILQGFWCLAVFVTQHLETSSGGCSGWSGRQG